MEISIRPVWAEIDLNLIENNIREIKKSVPNKEVIAVIKADAYGHGAIDIAPVLLENGKIKQKKEIKKQKQKIQKEKKKNQVNRQ